MTTKINKLNINKLSMTLVFVFFLGSLSVFGDMKIGHEEGRYHLNNVEVAQRVFQAANERVEEILKNRYEARYQVRMTQGYEQQLWIASVCLYQELFSAAVIQQKTAALDLLECQLRGEIGLS